MMSGMILSDLKKAFAHNDHAVFFQKLYAIGFSKLLIDLNPVSPTYPF